MEENNEGPEKQPEPHFMERSSSSTEEEDAGTERICDPACCLYCGSLTGILTVLGLLVKKSTSTEVDSLV